MVAGLLSMPPIVMTIGYCPGLRLGTNRLACAKPTKPGGRPRNWTVGSKLPTVTWTRSVARASEGARGAIEGDRHATEINPPGCGVCGLRSHGQSAAIYRNRGSGRQRPSSVTGAVKYASGRDHRRPARGNSGKEGVAAAADISSGE